MRVTWAAFAHATPISDLAGYDRLAWQRLESAQFGAPGYWVYRTPAYPAPLAAIYGVCGHSWKVAGLV